MLLRKRGLLSLEDEITAGEQYAYSNTGYSLLAQIAEKVSGVRFEDFLEENIFVPSQMTSTKLLHRRKNHLTIENLAYGMVFEGGRHILPDDSKGMNFVVPLDGVSGCGSVYSTVQDLFLWDKILCEEKLLSKGEQAMMYTPGKLNSGEIAGDGYGFGWEIANDPALGLIVQHGGYWPGYDKQYTRFLDANRVLIVLSCRDCIDARAASAFVGEYRRLPEAKTRS